MNAHSRRYFVCFVVAAGLHAGVLLTSGKVFQTRAEFATSAGQSIELTLVESVGEPRTDPPLEPEPRPLPTPPEPIAEPPADPLPAEPEMIEPQREIVAPPTPTVPPRVVRSPTTAHPKPATAPRRAGMPGANVGFGARTQAKPDYLSNPLPPYPAPSRQAGEQGVVMLLVRVTEQGRAASVRVKHSSGFARLDQAALHAVERWRFRPARVGSIAVTTEVEVPVRFHLR